MEGARRGGKNIKRERQGKTEAAGNIHICPCSDIISRNWCSLTEKNIGNSIKRHEKSPAWTGQFSSLG